MELKETSRDGVVILEMSGKLDAVTTPELTAWFDNKSDADPGRFIFDCAGLTYLSSAGLRGFLTVAKQIKSRQGRVAFCGLGGVVLEVFRVSGFVTIFETFPTIDAGLEAVKEA